MRNIVDELLLSGFKSLSYERKKEVVARGRPEVKLNWVEKLLHLGKNYPKGFDFFRERLKASFMKHRDVTDPAHIEQLLVKAEYVTKELEALYMLRKYRTLKRRYYDERPGGGASS